MRLGNNPVDIPNLHGPVAKSIQFSPSAIAFQAWTGTLYPAAMLTVAMCSLPNAGRSASKRGVA
jgi:hypothetical protein